MGSSMCSQDINTFNFAKSSFVSNPHLFSQLQPCTSSLSSPRLLPPSQPSRRPSSTNVKTTSASLAKKNAAMAASPQPGSVAPAKMAAAHPPNTASSVTTTRRAAVWTAGPASVMAVLTLGRTSTLGLLRSGVLLSRRRVRLWMMILLPIRPVCRF